MKLNKNAKKIVICILIENTCIPLLKEEEWKLLQLHPKMECLMRKKNYHKIQMEFIVKALLINRIDLTNLRIKELYFLQVEYILVKLQALMCSMVH